MYEFSWVEIKALWVAFNRHADQHTHFLYHTAIQAALQDVFSAYIEVDYDLVVWLLNRVSAPLNGAISWIKFIRGSGDLFEYAQTRGCGPPRGQQDVGRRFVWREVADLFKLFITIDHNESGDISIPELFKAVRIINPRSKIRDAIAMFSVLDIDESQAIDFPEFVRGIAVGSELQSAPSIRADSSMFSTSGPSIVSSGPTTRVKGITPTLPRVVSPERDQYTLTNDRKSSSSPDLYYHERVNTSAASSTHFPRNLHSSRPPDTEPDGKHNTENNNNVDNGNDDVDGENTNIRTQDTNIRLYQSWSNKKMAAHTPVLDTISPKSDLTKPSFFPTGNHVPPPRKPQKLKPIQSLRNTK